MTWGVEDIVRERFGAAGVAPERIAFERATCTFRHPGPPSELLDAFRLYYGPTMNAFEAAARDRREEQLHAELATLFETHNRGGASRTEISASFLKVTIDRTRGLVDS